MDDFSCKTSIDFFLLHLKNISVWEKVIKWHFCEVWAWKQQNPNEMPLLSFKVIFFSDF